MSKVRSLVLTGAPGSGKSTVGRALSEALGRDWIDVDEQIVAAEQTPIAEIFAGRGEAYFRELEVRHTTAALGSGAIVSIGGGAVTSATIAESLAEHLVIWLRVSPGEAAKRVGMNVARPLLLGNVRGRLMQLLKERTPLYEKVSSIAVDTDGRATADIVAEIVTAVEELESEHLIAEQQGPEQRGPEQQSEEQQSAERLTGTGQQNRLGEQ